MPWKQRGEGAQAARKVSADTRFINGLCSLRNSSAGSSAAGEDAPPVSARVFEWLAKLCMALAWFGLAGCGSPQAMRERRAVVPVTGRLMFQGRPAAGALVVLHPTDAGFERGDWTAGFPRGRVAEDGSFRLTTYEQDDGAPRGKYVLVVSWNRSWIPDARAVESVSEDRGGEDWLAGRFADPQVSQLSCVVEGTRADLGRIELH